MLPVSYSRLYKVLTVHGTAETAWAVNYQGSLLRCVREMRVILLIRLVVAAACSSIPVEYDPS